MRKVKVVAFGTANFIKKYSIGLKQDCEQLKYDCELNTIPDFNSISEINFYIQQQIIDRVSKAQDERLCFVDPECRILKRFPKEWIDSDVPWCTYKIQHEDYAVRNYEFGPELPCRIAMQPFFCGKEDLTWMQWWLKASTDASDIENKNYVPNELLLELALTFNNIKFKHGIINYNREYKGPHIVVKGSWSTKDTIVQHPCIHATLDTDMLAADTERRENNVISTRDLHNHFQDYDTIKLIDNLMLKEKTDIKDWPTQTLPVRINTINWFRCDEWLFRPSTGEVKNVNYSLIKYHPSINIKLKQNIMTPAVKLYKETFKC